ncbi:Arm DNA-binding domain-containing protein [Caballeronia sordidicola]|uniref:Arm DNA-binding domain-containing protein n=1 Tax=Caballeronia sordidicola TaxID=196367 RepID=UPI00094FD333
MGLYLPVSPAGTKGWLFKYTLFGRPRGMGLGAYPAIQLAEARNLIAIARSLKAKGEDPLVAKQRTRRIAWAVAANRMTVEAVAKTIHPHSVGCLDREVRSRMAAHIRPVRERNGPARLHPSPRRVLISLRALEEWKRKRPSGVVKHKRQSFLLAIRMSETVV